MLSGSLDDWAVAVCPFTISVSCVAVGSGMAEVFNGCADVRGVWSLESGWWCSRDGRGEKRINGDSEPDCISPLFLQCPALLVVGHADSSATNVPPL